MKRIIVDPNSFARRSPALSVCGYDDLIGDELPVVGEHVLAIQPDEEGTWVADAVVDDIVPTYQLVYVRVDWSSFREDA